MTGSRGSARRGAGRKAGRGSWPIAGDRIAVVALLAMHAALVIWGAARNAVTFDENFHLPAGVAYVARGYPGTSVAQPPLVKALCAIPALAAGARVPPDSLLCRPAEMQAAEAFMRANADRFHRVYFSARLAVTALSCCLGWLIWRFARRIYGRRSALLALATYVIMPEALAHAGLVGMDLATGLGFTATVYAFWIFCRTGRWRWWAWTALAVAATFLTRFSAFQLAPILIVLAGLGAIRRRLRRPRRVWLGLVLLLPTTWLALQIGYLGWTTLAPLSHYEFRSPLFGALRAAHPGWRLPLPDPYIGGLDYLFSLASSGNPVYLLGRIRDQQVWYYFPLALLFKWPLGWLSLLIARAVAAIRVGLCRARGWHEAFLLIPVVVVLGTSMASRLDYGVRYVFPILPFLCVWCGGLVSRRRPPAAHGAGRLRAAVAIACVAWIGIETAASAPWYLSFFNRAAGGPGGGDRLVNDSNVDWGQGLIALRDEMARRGIARIHLAYHGTTDPAVYGIDYVPYLGGVPGPESDWLAVSSFYFVGLPQRMMTPRGRTDFLSIDFGPLRSVRPEARPAHCMYLFRLR